MSKRINLPRLDYSNSINTTKSVVKLASKYKVQILSVTAGGLLFDNIRERIGYKKDRIEYEKINLKHQEIIRKHEAEI